MGLVKKYLKSKPVCKVTFKVEPEVANGAKKIVLIGEFNDWNFKQPIELTPSKDGSFETTVELRAGYQYQFRYLMDGMIWENDHYADDYVPTGFSFEENSVVAV